MPQYTIDIGATANDGTGDPLRTAFNEVNLNFDQVFAAGPVLSNVRIANNTILTTTTNGNLILAPNGVGVVQSNVHIVPNTSNVRNLGSSTQRWSSLYVQYLDLSGALSVGDLTVSGNLTVTGNTIQIGNLVTDAKTIQLANTASTANAANGSGMTVGANDAIATFLFSSSANAWITNLGLNVTGNIIPAANVTYSLGNSTNYWANLWVANNTIYIGGVALGMTAGNVLTVNGNAVLQNGSDSTISTTGNITAGNVLTAGVITATGNITGNYFIGNGSQLTGLAATYGNANVVANLANLGSNPISTTGNVTGGNLLFGTGIVSGTGNITGGNILTGGLISASGNITSGNILTGGLISATGNITGNYIFGNGSQLTGILSSLPVSNGTSNINIATANGNVTVASAGNTWTFGTDGSLTLPGANADYTIATQSGYITVGNLLIGQGGSLFNSNNDSWALYGNISDPGTSISIPSDAAAGNGTPLVLENQISNVEIRSGFGTWTFDTTGTLTVPASNVVPGQISTQTTTQNESGFDLSITAGNTDGCTQPGGDLYLSAGVGYNGVSHGAGNVNIVTGDRYGNITGNIWRFDSSGALTLPLGSATIKNTAGNAVAFGLDAGLTSQGANAVAIGIYSGVYSQSTNAVAVGTLAGNGGRVTTNYVSGAVSPSTTLVVTSTTGIVPGMVITGTGFFGTITVVTVTNSTTLEISASAVFTPSGALTFTGSQGDNSVAIGTQAGQVQQGQFAVAIGDNAGNSGQGTDAVAIGASAGLNTQGAGAVAFGQGTGETSQGANAVALGKAAGQVNQGINSIAIGQSAGLTNQANNSIILNATGAALDQTTANTFTVAPVRNDVANTGQVMFYNTTSKEITYGNVISVAGNITGGNLSIGTITTTGNITFAGDSSSAPSLNNFNVNAVSITATAGNLAVINGGAGGESGGFISATRGISATGNVTSGNVLTGGLISAAGNVTGGNVSVTGNVTGNTAGFAIGYRDIPQVSFTGNATIATTDAGKHFYSTQSTDYVLTIANNASQGFQVGAAITVVNQGTGNITVAQGSGVSLYLAGNATSGNRTVATFGMATIMKVATDTWFINGTGVS